MKSILILCAIIGIAVGHSFISVPASRTNQGQSQTGCRGPACVGPCDGTNAANRGTVRRGQAINIKWPRNNHPGGFIRFAWAPTGESNSHSAFDNRVSQFVCHERGTQAGGACAPGSAGDPNGGDQKSAADPSGHCQADVVVPNWVSDGQWTLQWAWFGGGFALGDYYSCVDYTVSGGNGFDGNQGAPSFQGGDYGNPGGSVCKTFNTDALHRCRNEPCDNPVFNGQIRNVAPAGVTGGGTPPPITPPTPPVDTGNGKCYSDPAKAINLNGRIAPQCNQAGTRCADSMCCSQYGFCGATPEYCNGNTGDWRLTPCSGNGGLCYNGNSGLNLDGYLSQNGRCGPAAVGARCADGQCCSQYGYCGVTADHCNGNKGDWRLVACTAGKNISPRDGIYSNSTVDEVDYLGSSAGKVAALGLLSAAAIAL